MKKVVLIFVMLVAFMVTSFAYMSPAVESYNDGTIHTVNIYRSGPGGYWQNCSPVMKHWVSYCQLHIDLSASKSVNTGMERAYGTGIFYNGSSVVGYAHAYLFTEMYVYGGKIWYMDCNGGTKIPDYTRVYMDAGTISQQPGNGTVYAGTCYEDLT